MPPLDPFKYLKDHKVCHISLPLTDGEKLELECVAHSSEPPRLEVYFLPGQLPIEEIDQQARCRISMDADGSSLSLVASVEEIENDRKLRLVHVEVAAHIQKRAFFRVNTQFEVGLQCLERGKIELNEFSISGEAVNLSGGGVLVCLQESLKLHQQVNLQLTLPGPTPYTINCIGHVVRVNEEGQNKYNTAFHFDRIEEEDRDKIIAFCLVEQRRQLRMRVQVVSPV